MLCGMVVSQLARRRSNLADFSVGRALLLSLLLHGAVVGTLELGYQTGWWKATLLFFRQQEKLDQQMARLQAQARQEQVQEIPLVFIDVDPVQASPEPPKDAKYYSALNSRAANPDPSLDLPVPKVDGRQDKVPQTMEKARPEPQPLQAAPKPPPPSVVEAQPEKEPPPEPKPVREKEQAVIAEVKPEPPPQAPEKPGDLAYAKPAEKPLKEVEVKKPEPIEAPRTPPVRPRTLEAARRQKGGVAGEKMKQAGGVKRFALEPSFDVRATPFGTYDAAIIAAIQKRWYDLLASRDFAANYSGKVVLEFRLNSDGRVTDMKVSENGVTEILGLLCQRAVQDPAPFAAWPPDLRRLVGKEYRDVRFTFYYN